MMPGCFQVGTHLQQTVTLLRVQRRRTLSNHRLQLFFQPVYGYERGVPARSGRT
jgi:hypothetical protein